MPRHTGKYSKWQLDYARDRVKSHARPRAKLFKDDRGKPFMDPHFEARRKYNYFPPGFYHRGGAANQLKAKPYKDFFLYKFQHPWSEMFRPHGRFRTALRRKLNHRRWHHDDLLFNHQLLLEEFDNQWPPQPFVDEIADADIAWNLDQVPDNPQNW